MVFSKIADTCTSLIYRIYLEDGTVILYNDYSLEWTDAKEVPLEGVVVINAEKMIEIRGEGEELGEGEKYFDTSMVDVWDSS
jgi:hypothetical protein